MATAAKLKFFFLLFSIIVEVVCRVVSESSPFSNSALASIFGKLFRLGVVYRLLAMSRDTVLEGKLTNRGSI